MPGKRVCVLGASGCIGGHLVPGLLEQGYQVTAVVRTLASASRIGRYDIDMVNADLSKISDSDLAEILLGHEVVVDCAYSKNPDPVKSIAESRRLATSICAASKLSGIKKLIHYGTISVYPRTAGVISENTECRMQGDAYADGKLAAESVFMQQSTGGPEVVVLQLPVVLGPFMPWTVSSIAQMSGQQWTIPDDIRGTCSPIFVADVVHATLLAIEHNAATTDIAREKILLPGTAAINWDEFYTAHADLSPQLALNKLPRDDVMARIAKAQKLQQPWQRFLARFSSDGDFRQLILSQWGIRWIYRSLRSLRGQDAIDNIKSRLAGDTVLTGSTLPEKLNMPVKLIDHRSLLSFDTMPAIKSDKALRILGFSPNVSFKDGLRECEEWLRWARLLN